MTGDQGDLFGELPVGDDAVDASKKTAVKPKQWSVADEAAAFVEQAPELELELEREREQEPTPEMKPEPELLFTAALVDAPALDGPAALQRLKQWTEAGWLRRLDTAFARFIAERAPDASAAVLISAALVAHMEGRGHTCLRIDEWLAAPAELLAWPADGLVDLQAALSQLPADAPAWLRALSACSAVRADAADERQQPLILEGSRLYLRRYWRYEGDVAAQVLQRGALHDPVDEPATRLWLDRLFGEHASSTAPDWQRIACAVALRGRLSIITGGPGTGKTYTAARLLALLFASSPHPERLRVALAAPTGKAAARLKQAIDTALEELQGRLGDALPLRELASHMGAARTLHSLLGARADTRKFRHDAAHPLDVDVLLVDEASMVHLEMMAALLAALPPQARVVFLGDKDQLASVEAGAVLADLCRDAERGRYTEPTRSYVRAVTGQVLPNAFIEAGSPLAQQTVMLRESRRFGGPIGKLALAVNEGQARTAAALLHEGEAEVLRWLPAAQPAAVVRLALQGRDGASGGYRSYLDLLKQAPLSGTRSKDAGRAARADGMGHAGDPHTAWVRDVLIAYERFRVLCAVKDGDWGVAGLNRAIEAALADAGLLDRTGEWYEGRPVMVTRNDYGVGVFNGDIGIALRSPDDDGALRAYFLEGPDVRSVRVSRLSDVETAYAMTVHKSQGSEFEHTVLVLPQESSRVLTRELVYTGITRARKAFTLVSAREDALGGALGQITQRSSGLPGLLGG